MLELNNQESEQMVTDMQQYERHLVLGASTAETHIKDYFKEKNRQQLRGPIQVVCLCKEPILEPVKSLDPQFFYWSGDFNSRETWCELILNFGEASFSKIMFDSSTSKFIHPEFWNLESGHFPLITRLLRPGGSLHFDSFHTGTVSYPPNFNHDLALTGKLTGYFYLLPLLNKDVTRIMVTKTMKELGQKDQGFFKELEERVMVDEQFQFYLDSLNSIVEPSRNGHFAICDDNLEPYPIRNTVYTISKYLVFRQSNYWLNNQLIEKTCN